MTTQDFNKGLDLTGQTTITATQLNQLVDVARVAVDKGLIISTTDTATDTPDVPDPDLADGQGVIPTWWKRYVWKRNLDPTGFKTYAWDETITSDPVYLKWVDLTADASAALTAAQTALSAALAAQNAANVAVSQATTAYNKSVDAITEADAAKAEADAAMAAVASLQAGVVPTGMAFPFAPPFEIVPAFSTTVNQGWLECDGAEVSTTIFSALFAAIGRTYGLGNSTTTFNVPDYRGRTVIGAGQGSGLSLRTVGDKVGEEAHILTKAESGRHAHADLVADNTAHDAASGSGNADCNLLVSTAAAGGHAKILNSSIGSDATPNDAHNNMQPSVVARWVIKT